MQDITVSKTKLIDILKKNREDHIAIHKEANEAFKTKLADVLGELLQDVSEGKIPDDYQRQIIDVRKPECHTEDYERTLRMLDLHQGDTIELDQHEFRSLVDDEWEWSERWALSNSHYSTHEKVLSKLR